MGPPFSSNRTAMLTDKMYLDLRVFHMVNALHNRLFLVLITTPLLIPFASKEIDLGFM